MARVSFTPNLSKWVECGTFAVSGTTVREVLAEVFRAYPKVEKYLLDDQGSLRKHVVVFVDGEMVTDRAGLSDAVEEGSEIYVSQALSGG